MTLMKFLAIHCRKKKARESVAARFEECIKKDKKRRSEVDRK